MIDTVIYSPRTKIPPWRLWSLTASLLISLFAVTVHASTQVILEGERFHPAQGRQGMVATSHSLATSVALDVLKGGGNAVDAAVTAGVALAVTQPRPGDAGGGGLLLVSPRGGAARVGAATRETARAVATGAR